MTCMEEGPGMGGGAHAQSGWHARMHVVGQNFSTFQVLTIRYRILNMCIP